MKQNILRLKAIFRVNLSYAVYASALVGLTYTLIGVISIKTDWLPDYTITNKFVIASLALFFVIPIVSFFIDKLLTLISGTDLAQSNTKLIKRNLFVLAGCVWSSIGCVIIASSVKDLDNTMLSSAVFGLIAWYLLNRQFIKYVFAL